MIEKLDTTVFGQNNYKHRWVPSYQTPCIDFLPAIILFMYLKCNLIAMVFMRNQLLNFLPIIRSCA